MTDNTGITPLTPAEQALAEYQVAHESLIQKDLIAFDQLVNVLTGGNPDETISARTARDASEDQGIGKVVGEVFSHGLDLFQKDHGAQAEAGDLERAKIIVAIEENSGTLPTK